MTETALEVVPAYWASNSSGQSVPVIVSLLLFDDEHKPRLLPAVEASINRAVDATGRVGLATATVADADELGTSLGRWMLRAITMPGVIVLLRCQSAECAQRVMDWLHATYTLSLVRDSRSGTSAQRHQ
ncbi:hypothetical protein [Azohydromonas australica]|uniref:hypothetical protein n=1 Tax=Azohydromonas australica TaxID=364039 RepID=UPI000401C54E|nr:hypothetical protein [Azohydromonas australica]